jgi:hypothetical protein
MRMGRSGKDHRERELSGRGQGKITNEGVGSLSGAKVSA